MTPSVAASTSALVTFGPHRSRLSTNAISPSALGCMSESKGTLVTWSPGHLVGDHARQQVAEVRPRNAKHLLHHPGRHANFFANHLVAIRKAAPIHVLLNAVGVINGDIGMPGGQGRNSLARYKRFVQFIAEFCDQVIVHGGVSYARGCQ